MGKLFGTDGIRGVVGENLTADLAFRTGKAIAAVLKEEKGRKPVITIGKDTRISSDMLESALIAGICSVGVSMWCHCRRAADTGGRVPDRARRARTRASSSPPRTTPTSTTASRSSTRRAIELPDAIEEQVEEKILTDIYPAATHGEIGVLRHGSAAVPRGVYRPS